MKKAKSFYIVLTVYIVTLRKMGEVEAKAGRGTRGDFRYDRHTASLLTDHLVFSPKYRGKVSLGEVAEAAEAAEEIIRENGKEFDIEVIDNFFFMLTGSVLNSSWQSI